MYHLVLPPPPPAREMNYAELADFSGMEVVCPRCGGIVLCPLCGTLTRIDNKIASFFCSTLALQSLCGCIAYTGKYNGRLPTRREV